MLQVRTMRLRWVLSVHWLCRAATLLKSLIFFIKLNQNCALPIFQSAFWPELSAAAMLRSSSFPDNVAALQETSTVWSPDVHSPKRQCYQHLFFFIALPQTGFGNSSDTTGPTGGQPLTHTRLKVTSSTNHRCSNLIGWLTNFCLSYFTSRGLFCQKASYSLFHGCIQRTGYQGSNTGLH